MSTSISRASTTRPPGSRRDDRRRPARRAERRRASLVDESRGGQLADQAADRAPGQPGAGDEVRARERAVDVELANDRAEIGPPNRLAALPDLVAANQPRTTTRFVILSFKSRCQTRNTGGAVSRSMRIRAGTIGAVRDRKPRRSERREQAAVRDPVDGRHRPQEGHPGHAHRGPRRGRCDRLAERRHGGTGRRRAGASRRAHGSYEALLADPEVDAIYIPLPNHLHARVDDRRRPRPASTSCARSRSRSPSTTPSGWSTPARRAGVRLMEAFMYRLHPSWTAVLELVASGRIGAAAGRPELVLVLQRRRRPTSGTSSTTAAARCWTSAATPSTCRGCCSAASRRTSRRRFAAIRVHRRRTSLTSAHPRVRGVAIATFTCATRTETDQRVEIYGSEGRISVGIPFNIPPDRPDRACRSPPAASHRSRPASRRSSSTTADPYGVEARGLRCRDPRRPADAHSAVGRGRATCG